jgi:hypothetical protein
MPPAKHKQIPSGILCLSSQSCWLLLLLEEDMKVQKETVLPLLYPRLEAAAFILLSPQPRRKRYCPYEAIGAASLTAPSSSFASLDSQDLPSPTMQCNALRSSVLCSPESLLLGDENDDDDDDESSKRGSASEAEKLDRSQLLSPVSGLRSQRSTSKKKLF